MCVYAYICSNMLIGMRFMDVNYLRKFLSHIAISRKFSGQGLKSLKFKFLPLPCLNSAIMVVDGSVQQLLGYLVFFHLAY